MAVSQAARHGGHLHHGSHLRPQNARGGSSGRPCHLNRLGLEDEIIGEKVLRKQGFGTSSRPETPISPLSQASTRSGGAWQDSDSSFAGSVQSKSPMQSPTMAGTTGSGAAGRASATGRASPASRTSPAALRSAQRTTQRAPTDRPGEARQAARSGSHGRITAVAPQVQTRLPQTQADLMAWRGAGMDRNGGPSLRTGGASFGSFATSPPARRPSTGSGASAGSSFGSSATSPLARRPSTASTLASAGTQLLSAGGVSSTSLGSVRGSGAGGALLDRRSSFDEEQDILLQQAMLESLQQAEDEAIMRSLRDADEVALQQSLRDIAEMERNDRENQGAAEPTEAEAGRPCNFNKSTASNFAPCQWLDDSCIGHIYAMLAEGNLGVAATALQKEAQALPEDVLLMDPDIAFWLTMKEDPEEIQEALEDLKLSKRKLVLCPINDSDNGDLADHGTHWSLLVCRRHERHFQFVHYDSLPSASGGRSLQQAKTLARHLSGNRAQVAEGSCAKQTNGFDCGVYVLVFSELILSAFLKEHSATRASQCSWDDHLTSVLPQKVYERRSFFHKICASSTSTTASSPQLAV